MGGAALDALIGKGAELIASAAEARQAASKATEIAAEARRIAQQGRALGKSSEDVAKLEQDAADADKIASDATQDAEKYEQEGQKAQKEANEAKAAKTGCFVAGTPVLMGDETFKPIEQLKVGDEVLARDPATGQTAAKKVLRVTVRPHIATLILHLADGQSIETTANHPFFVSSPAPDQPAKSVPAGQLAIGNSIVTRAGPGVAVAGIEQTGQTKTVYNCTVEDFHTYFVGKSKLWVHNVDCTITISDDRLGKVIDRHTVDGIDRDFDSFFDSSSPEDIRNLITDSQNSQTIFQPETGNYVRVVDAGRDIGWTRTSGATRTYTVITDAEGNLVTAFPGIPTGWQY